jgi:hypothetical protein
MDWQDTIKISKLDAARRQIDTAVRLYFDRGDPVSIHTLAAAAFEILKDLDKQAPKTGTFYDLIAQYVQPEYRKVVTKTLKEAQNFFKHADRDAEAVFEFSLAEPELFLLGACDKFRELGGHRSAEMAVFIIWFTLQNPGMITLKTAIPFQEFPAELKYQPNQRSEFFAALIGLAGSAVANLDPDKS